MIPKIIHQIWFGDQSQRPKEIMGRWKELNPSWDYMLWTEKEIKEVFGKLKNQKHFDSYHKKLYPYKPTLYLCGQSDIARYEILYKYGGFFIDADAYPLRPLKDEFCENDSFTVYENEKQRGQLLANGYLASNKNNKLMELLIEEINQKNSVNKNEPWQTTGPMLLTKTIKKYNYTATKIYPSYYFIPIHFTGEKYQGDDIENIYCDQLWGSTHNNDYNKIKKRFK